MSTTPITHETCPFCQHAIQPGNLVCLTCGAQSEIVEHEGPAWLCILAMLAALAVSALSVMSAMGVGHILAKISIFFGMPEEIWVPIGGVGMLVMLFVVPVLAWKVFMRGWRQTATREVVWSRCGKYAGARVI